MMPNFELRGGAAENVGELRRAMGSVLRPLARGALAKVIGAQHPGRKPNGTSVQRWEEDGVEPDYTSLRIMTALANAQRPKDDPITMEQFMYGPTGQPATIPPANDRSDLNAFHRVKATEEAAKATEQSASERAAAGHPTRSGRPGKGRK